MMRSLLSRAFLALAIATAPAVLAVPQLRAAIHAPSIAPVRGARVVKTSTQSINNNTVTAVSWDTTVSFDTCGCFSAGAATKFTVPAGASLIEITANGDWASSSTGRRDIYVGKNGSGTYNMGAVIFSAPAAANEYEVTITSGPLAVVPGDYFELIAFQNSGGAVNFGTNNRAWFSIKVLQ